MKLFRFLLVSLFAVTLFGCGDKEPEHKGDTDGPGYAATMYFYAIYRDKDINKASEYTTPRLSRIMQSYGSAEQFARNLLNLQYDEVNIEVDRTDMAIRQQYGDKATINLIFSGMNNGKRIDDFRSVNMVRKGGRWYVEKIKDDPYAH